MPISISIMMYKFFDIGYNIYRREEKLFFLFQGLRHSIGGAVKSRETILLFTLYIQVHIADGGFLNLDYFGMDRINLFNSRVFRFDIIW